MGPTTESTIEHFLPGNPTRTVCVPYGLHPTGSRNTFSYQCYRCTLSSTEETVFFEHNLHSGRFRNAAVNSIWHNPQWVTQSVKQQPTRATRRVISTSRNQIRQTMCNMTSEPVLLSWRRTWFWAVDEGRWNNLFKIHKNKRRTDVQELTPT
jgi:hypothetical protein